MTDNPDSSDVPDLSVQLELQGLALQIASTELELRSDKTREQWQESIVDRAFDAYLDRHPDVRSDG